MYQSKSNQDDDYLITKFKIKQRNKDCAELKHIMNELNNSTDNNFNNKKILDELTSNSYLGTILPKEIKVYYFRMPSMSSNTTEDIKYAEKQFEQRLGFGDLVAINDEDGKLIIGKISAIDYKAGMVNINKKEDRQVPFFSLGRFSPENKQKLMQYIKKIN